MTYDSNTSVKVLNLSEETFVVEELGVLTSVFNTRRSSAEVKYRIQCVVANITVSSGIPNYEVYACITVGPIGNIKEVMFDSPELARVATVVNEHDVLSAVTDCSGYDTPLVALKISADQRTTCLLVIIVLQPRNQYRRIIIQRSSSMTLRPETILSCSFRIYTLQVSRTNRFQSPA